MTAWNRLQVVSSLFWTKVVALIEAVQPILEDGPEGDNVLVHTAFATPSCPPAVISVVAALFPDELTQPDNKGRWPIHYAAQRAWHAWDFPRTAPTHEIPASASLLDTETLRVLRLAMKLSPQESLSSPDLNGRWILHQVIDTLCRTTFRSQDVDNLTPDILSVVAEVVQVYPDVLMKRDQKTSLLPFLQATAQCDSTSDLFATSMTFELLKMNPTALMSLY